MHSVRARQSGEVVRGRINYLPRICSKELPHNISQERAANTTDSTAMQGCCKLIKVKEGKRNNHEETPSGAEREKGTRWCKNRLQEDKQALPASPSSPSSHYVRERCCLSPVYTHTHTYIHRHLQKTTKGCNLPKGLNIVGLGGHFVHGVLAPLAARSRYRNRHGG